MTRSHHKKLLFFIVFSFGIFAAITIAEALNIHTPDRWIYQTGANDTDITLLWNASRPATCTLGNYSRWNGSEFLCAQDATSGSGFDPAGLYSNISSLQNSNASTNAAITSIGNWTNDKSQYANLTKNNTFLGNNTFNRTLISNSGSGNWSNLFEIAGDSSTYATASGIRLTDQTPGSTPRNWAIYNGVGAGGRLDFFQGTTKGGSPDGANNPLYLTSTGAFVTGLTASGSISEGGTSLNVKYLTQTGAVTALGNWTADKSSYATTASLSAYQLSSGLVTALGNWTADKSSYTPTANLGAYRNQSANFTCAAGSYLNSVAFNYDGTQNASGCAVDQTGSGGSRSVNTMRDVSLGPGGLDNGNEILVAPATVTGTAWTNTTARGCMFNIPENTFINFTRISTQISTLGATATVNMGIYNCTSNDQFNCTSNRLIINTSGVTPTVTGFATFSNKTANWSIGPGYYFYAQAQNCSASCATVAYRTTGVLGTESGGNATCFTSTVINGSLPSPLGARTASGTIGYPMIRLWGSG